MFPVRSLAGFLALPYLLTLLFLKVRGTERWAVLLVSAVGVAAFLVLLADFLNVRREGDRVLPWNPLLLWGGAAALALHAAFPSLAGTRVVPAAVFFDLGYFLPPAISVPSMSAAAAWLGFMAPGSPGTIDGIVSNAMLGLLTGGAGIFFRRRGLRGKPEEFQAREPNGGNRSLVLSWEEPQPGETPSSENATEETVLLRREMDLLEGIRRALEGLLPMVGASHVAYLSPAAIPGSSRHEGLLVSRGGGGPRNFSVPDTYVPVREATVFRRPFLENGPTSRIYAPPGLGGKSNPTGIVSVPVFRREAVEGALLAIRDDDGPWPDFSMPLIELVAAFVGRDIERIRLLHQGERYLLREDWYHRMVRKIAQVGGEEGEPEEGLLLRRQRVYSEAVGQLRRQVGADRALLIGTSDGGKTGWITWEEKETGAGGSDRPEPLEATYAGWVIRTGSRRIVSGDQGSSRGQEVLPSAWMREEERSFLLLPVAGVGGFRGAVVCCHRDGKRFNRQHAEIARDITEVLQLGLSHVGHLEELTKRASTDGLTGLANRKSFLQRLESELVRLDGRHPLAVIMMDIDHFKRINDSFGHPFGDEVLRRVASVLGKAVRRGDSVGRYGGEEFVLFLPMSDPVKALEGAERFRRMIRQMKFFHDGREVAVTASFGVSCAPRQGNSPEELLARADEALYLSKQRGRDRVTMFPG